MKKIKTKEELQIEINQLESKISELERSKLQSRTCLENSPVCTKIVDLDFNLQYMSNAGIRALKIDDISAFYGKPYPFSFFPGAYKIGMSENLLRAKETGETIIQEGEILDEKGNKLWFQATITPVYNKQGEIDHILVVSIDTSTRKQAEEKLKTSMEREKELADIVRKAPIAMAFGYPDGRLDNCNSAFSVLTGYSISELQQLNWNEVLTPSKWKSFEGKQLSQLGPSRKSVKYEKEYIHKDGHFVPIELTVSAKFDSAGNLIHYIGFAVDITDRKLAEKELKESEERFRNAITYAPYPLMIHSDGKVLQLSKEWIKQTGYTIDDIPTIEAWTLKAYGKDAVPSQEFIDNLYKIDKPQYDGEWEVKIKDGKSLLWDFSSSPIGKLPNGKKMVISMASDITERKKIEMEVVAAKQKAEINEKFYNTILDNMGDPVFVKDKHSRLLLVNNAFCKLFNLSKTKIIGKTLVEEVSPEEQDHFLKIDKQVIKDGLDSIIEETITVRGAKMQTISTRKSRFINNGEKFLVGVIRDITERTLAEQALSKSEERFELAMTATKDGLFDWNLLTNEIYFSPGWKNILGYKNDELANDFSVWEKLTKPEDVEESWRIQQEVINKQRDRFEIEFKMKHKDGHWVDVLARAEAFFDANGKAIRMVGTHVDITERKQTKEKLTIALNKALESDRLKSAFLANMSHEIRTPMNGIRGFINLLREPNLSHSEINTYSDIINKSSDRLLNTINDIIDLSRIEAGEILVSKDETSINSMMDELYSFYSPEAKLKGLFLVLKPSTEQLSIITDSHKLYGILSNLIKNAIKYTDKGSITFGYVSRMNTGSVLNEQDRGSEVEFFVEDTGIGVPKERMQAIFNRFEQADIDDKRAFEGSGLGLAISKAFVVMLDGEIHVESELGIGSKFIFTIPHNKIKKVCEMKISKTIDIKTSKFENLNILVVEDDEVSSVFFKTLLEGVFQKVILAKNGIEAIQLCKNGSEVDLVLMDIKMPLMDGYDATREIRKFNKDLVIIAQTAYALPGDKEKAIEVGCNDYISKPINKELLLEIISKHVCEYSI